jgi:DNA mismatch repair protein MutS
VIRIVTPGTVLDEKSLERKQHNYIVSLFLANKVVGIAATDLSTGDLHANEFSITDDRSLDQIVEHVFTQLQPSECIVAADQYQQLKEQKVFKRFPHTAVFAFDGWNEWTNKPAKTIQKYFQNKSATKSVISHLLSAEIATAALLGYLQHTQKMVVTHLHTIQLLLSEKYLKMDRSTMENLELFRPLTERQQVGSLLDVIDHTRTAMGGRLLRQWLLQPLIDKNAIEKRLATVSFFLTQTHARASLIDFLSELNDIERIISRLSAGLGNPKDLKSLENSLQLAISIKELLTPQESGEVSLPPLLVELLEKINAELQQLINQLNSTIVADPPFDPKQGYLIQPGINSELDALRSVIEKSRDWIAELEIKEKERSGISSLKIKFNQVFGFYIEISNSNLHLAPADYTLNTNCSTPAPRY